MIPKRKKKLKIDNTEEIEVVDLENVNSDYFEEFTLPTIDSGMEAEEEKEIHLKNIIEKKSGEIPIPNIIEIPEFKKHDVEIQSKFYKYHKDVDCPYIYSDIDYKLIQKYNLNRRLYDKIILEYKHKIDSNKRNDIIYNCTNLSKLEDFSITDQIRNEIIKNIKHKFLFREETEENKSYVCFRKRIIKPSRKNRRSESYTQEKIVKLNTELLEVSEIIDLIEECNQVDEELDKLNLQISSVVNNILTKKPKLKNHVKALLDEKLKTKNITTVDTDVWHDVMVNRDKIRFLRRRLKDSHPMDGKDLERETVAYKNYLKDQRLREWQTQNL